MEKYLKDNLEYWRQGYEAENVESFVFRPYGRILKAQLGIDGSNGENILDFGCGSGASLRFFKSKGFRVFRVEMTTERFQVKDYYVCFTENESQLIDKFHLFRKLQTGFYSFRYREDEGMSHHYTYFGVKD